jgi:hypothetical protein
MYVIIHVNYTITYYRPNEINDIPNKDYFTVPFHKWDKWHYTENHVELFYSSHS